MIANAVHIKWKFIVEFEDEETGAIEGTLGEAADRDECELLVEDEMEYQRLRGYIRVTAEAVELCEQCEGEGSIPVEDGIVSICDACGGRIGILSTFKRRRGAEMMSTQSHLRAAS
jgi:DnaJ-class molecular chaperone